MKKGGKLHRKDGEKGLKNASFWVITSKHFRPPPRRPQTYSSGKKIHPKRGGGGMIEIRNIYPCDCTVYSELPSNMSTMLRTELRNM